MTLGRQYTWLKRRQSAHVHKWIEYHSPIVRFDVIHFLGTAEQDYAVLT